MTSHEESLQRLRPGTEQEADFQACAEFKDILAQSPDGNAGMRMRLAETIGQGSQRLFRPVHFGVTQLLERSVETRAEQDGGFSHVSAFP